jgi:hypothetical protein
MSNTEALLKEWKADGNVITEEGLELFVAVRPSGAYGVPYREKVIVKSAPEVWRIYDDVPQWFIDAMHKVQPTSSWWESELPGGPGEEAIMVFQDAFEHSRKFMDHAGWSKEYGKTVLVSEPYALNTEDLLELLKFINTCNLNLSISGESYHYPGATLRIRMEPKDVL